MRLEPVNLLTVAEKPILAEAKKTRFKLPIFVIGFIFVSTLAGAFFWHLHKSRLNTGSSNYNATILQPKKLSFLEEVKNFIFGTNKSLEGQKDDRINILILGIGGTGHDGAYLSDTNIIASIKPSTHEVVLISIPRDLGVNIPGRGFNKINHVSAYAEQEHPGQGAEYTRQFFSQLFNIPIQYYARVDFAAFEELINIVGGVNVNVAKDFTDFQFPGPNYSYRVVSFKAGEQTLNGEWALIYSRSRHGGNGEGSDFARAKRQQQVISSLKNKLLSFQTFLNPVNIKKIYDSISNHVETNFGTEEIIQMASLAKDIDTSKIKTLVLSDAPDSYLTAIAKGNFAPRTGDFSQINQVIQSVFQPTSTIALANKIDNTVTPNEKISATIPDVHIEIQNGTWHAGLASKTKKHLQDIGLPVEAVGNSIKRPIESTAMYIVKPAPRGMIELLSKELNLSSTTTLPKWLTTDSATSSEKQTAFQANTNVLIILGNDLANQFTLN